MSHNPFNNTLDDRFRGALVAVTKDEQTYTGTCRVIDYNRKGIILDGGVQGGVSDYQDTPPEGLSVIHVDGYDTLSKFDSGEKWVRLPPATLNENPYNVREYDDADMNKYARTIRDNGALYTFPKAWEMEGDYYLIGGHKRTEAARRANLFQIPVRVVNVDEEMMLQLFCDEHIPMDRDELNSDDSAGNRGWYTDYEISQSLKLMLEDWPEAFLRMYPQVDYWLDELNIETDER